MPSIARAQAARTARSIALTVPLLAAACGPSTAPADGSTPPIDAPAVTDVSPDAPAPPDALSPDALSPDALSLDVTSPDVASLDVASLDAPSLDASTADASSDALPPLPTVTRSPLTPGGALLDHDYAGGHSYDYNPSVIRSGSHLRFWWCGGGANPQHAGYIADNIYYADWDTSASRFTVAPTSVFNEGSPGTWDDYLDCNPSVIAGNFAPFGDGAHYTLALYYVAIPTTTSVNRIGVAFSNDGTTWRRWPTPVITPPVADSAHCSSTYGVGSPSTWNVDGRGTVRLFFEDYCHYGLYSATATDGVHFAAPEAVSGAGLSYCNSTHQGGLPTDANLAFDPAHGDWYATMDLGCGNFQRHTERGTIGFKLFRMHAGATASLASGRWTELATVDTSLNGSEINSWPALARDQFGNVDLTTTNLLQLWFSVATPRVATTSTTAEFVAASDPTHWDIAYALWRNAPDAASPLVRYQGSTHAVTTGWADRSRFPVDEGALGLLYQGPQPGTTPLYNCQTTAGGNFFASTDLLCEGQRIVGLEGFALADPHAGAVALYRCQTAAGDSFVSGRADCEGQRVVGLLGYAPPP